jgi:glutamate dehydrogenase
MGRGNVKATCTQLCGALTGAAEALVPWFLEQMPDSYFEDIEPAARLQHMGAILALRAAGQEPRLRIKSEDGRRITYVIPDAPGTLTTLMRDFHEGAIRAAKLYSSKDRQLIIDTFDLDDGEAPRAPAALVAEKLRATAHWLETHPGPRFSPVELERHVGTLGEDYLRACTPERIVSHAELCRQVRRTAASAVLLDNGHPRSSRIVVACADVSSANLLLRVANRLSTRAIDVTRAYVDTMRAAEAEPVVIISAVVELPGGGKLEPDSALWRGLCRDLARLEWLDAETLELGYRVPELELDGADVLMTYADLAHRLLVKSNRYVYSRAQIGAVLEQHLALAIKLVRLFHARFDPREPLDEFGYLERAAALRQEVAEKVDDEVAETVLATIVEAIGATCKTNHFVEGRYALALRLDPTLIMRAAPRAELPHGVFWVHGRGFNGFHLRFRETARGGVRVVRAPSLEEYLRECERHLDEVYELAYAQELKNKDIPEGGAKAVLLVHPARELAPCVRAFTDAILDLVTTDAATRARVVDRLGHDEALYLGPDENITPAHITWMVARARERGYPSPNALMSSKPGAGINHKEFGVTSEGIQVFLEVALQALGTDPRRQPFSLKLTGGPDGDVGGNLIKIAIREFGPRVRIVGIADGGGCLEDPAGLDQRELLRLVSESRSCRFFDRGKLSVQGRVVGVGEPEGVRLRNEMHNRVYADVFVPAGGRPETINGHNWSRFLGPAGPQSRLVVEGANLFMTDEARRQLFRAGVTVIKDSSANKCGVICSSYEVIASMLLSEAEFLAIKPAFVGEVLERLRRVARLEAELLFEARRHHPQTPLCELGVALSRAINQLSAAVAAEYPRLEREAPALIDATVRAYLPPSLLAVAGDRVSGRLPANYRAQLVATSIAAHVVYSEGLDYLRDVPESHLGALALAYVERERTTHALVAEVEGSMLPHAGEIARLLRAGGTRAALRAG